MRPIDVLFVDSGGLPAAGLSCRLRRLSAFVSPKGTGRGCVVEPPLGKGFEDEPLRTAESGGGFSLPLLTVYILSQVERFVKHFLKFFLPCPAVPLPKACGCVLSAWSTFI